MLVLVVYHLTGLKKIVVTNCVFVFFKGNIVQ